jgi:hypothetical protein
LELPLWEALKDATSAPDTANVRQLLDGLDVALLKLDTVGQLQVAAEAIAQIAQVVCDRSTLTFEELEATNSVAGPVMPSDAFDRYVRQTMAVDFDPFMAPLASLPRKVPERQGLSDEPASVVGMLDQVALLQALDEQMRQQLGLTELEAFNQAIGLAHAEDIAAESAAIAQWLRENQITTVPLVQLQRSTGLSLVQLWLALLLGGYDMEQRGQFYDLSSVWISVLS